VAARQVLDAAPHLSRWLIVSHGAPREAFEQEFPHFRSDCVALIETMIWRVSNELQRITPMEKARLQAEVQNEAEELGLESGEARQPATSPLLNKLSSFLTDLTRLLKLVKENCGGGDMYDPWFGDDVFSTVDDILKHFQPAPTATTTALPEAA
jgi:hypothetical protein